MLQKEIKNMNSTYTKYSFKDVCNILDNEEKRYLEGEGKNYSTLEILNNIKNRKNTFLTSK